MHYTVSLTEQLIQETKHALIRS